MGGMGATQLSLKYAFSLKTSIFSTFVFLGWLFPSSLLQILLALSKSLNIALVILDLTYQTSTNRRWDYVLLLASIIIMAQIVASIVNMIFLFTTQYVSIGPLSKTFAASVGLVP